MGMNGANGLEVERHGGLGAGKNVYGDGSWQLSVFVTDLQVERNLRVRGDLHIGGVMIQLVDSLGECHVLILIQFCILDLEKTSIK